jgi:ArsR family transcriptional regulator
VRRAEPFARLEFSNISVRTSGASPDRPFRLFAAQRSSETDARASGCFYDLAGEHVVVGLLNALSRVGERNSAEIVQVMVSYLRARDELQPMSRDELLDRSRFGTALCSMCAPRTSSSTVTYLPRSMFR